MGINLNDNGVYIKWSPLFDYTNIKTLHASELLPTPAGTNIIVDNNSNLDITDDLNLILATPKRSTDERVRRLGYLAELINKIDDNAEGKTSKVKINVDLLLNIADLRKEARLELLEKKARVLLHKAGTEVNTENIQNWVEQNQQAIDTSDVDLQVAKNVLKEIRNHEIYLVSIELQEASLKNSISARIGYIVQDLKNMVSAYSSVDDALSKMRSTAADSPKGKMTSGMSLVNPLTKFLMQYLNMMGKGVIGIAAVGEKIFFNLTYYWNEGLRSGNREWIRNLKFSHTFDRIQGRHSGNLSRKTVTTLANVNFDFNNVESIANDFREVALVYQEIALKYQNTKSVEFLKALHDRIRELHDGESQADLFISGLLSAATDNAKELILDKINAGTDLAGTYLYLITLGFDIQDIVEFMVSPAVSIVSSVSKSNMFNEDIPALNIDDVISLLQGNIFFGKFVSGTLQVSKQDPESGETTIVTSQVSSILRNIFSDNYATDSDLNGIKNFIIGSVIGTIKTSAHDLFVNYNLGQQEYGDTFRKILWGRNEKQVAVLGDFIDNIINKIKQEVSTKLDKLLALEEFYRDLDEFAEILKQASESTTLGTAFLGFNQGIPSSLEDLLNKLRTLLGALTKLESYIKLEIPVAGSNKTTKFTLNGRQGFILALRAEEKKGGNSLRNALKEYLYLKNQNITNSDRTEVYSIEDISNTVDRALDADIVEHFDIRKWLLDDNYKQITKDYYGLIKLTWNIFDIIDRIPQYNAIINKIFKMEYIINNEISLKTLLLNEIQTRVLRNNVFLDENQLRLTQKYVDERLIYTWIKDKIAMEYLFPVLKGWRYLTLERDISEPSTTNLTKGLFTEDGIASFKYVMENEIIPRLLSGDLNKLSFNENGDIVESEPYNLQNNEFIKNLVISVDNDGKSYFKLNIDMMTKDSTPENNLKYQEMLLGLIKLSNIEFCGHPLSDWFMLYNFVVSHNNYGSDRMTTIFGSFIDLIPQDNLIRQYYKYAGELDYDKSITLDNIGYNEQDLMIFVAPWTSESLEGTSIVPFIKLSVEGKTIYKKRGREGYYPISLLPKKNILGDLDIKTRQRRETINAEYFTLQAPNQNMVDGLLDLLLSKDKLKVYLALQVLTSRGVISLGLENCK